MAKRANPDYPRFEARTREDWRRWLAERHASAKGVWLVTFKKAADAPHLPYDAIVEEALAHGWVDSLPRKLDDRRTMLLVTPRKPGSSWSKANKDRIARLAAGGRLTEAGRNKVEAAKQDGSWQRLDDVEALAIPPDLAAALDADPSARTNFEAFPPSTRRGILEWILNGKRPETRAKRIADTARLAARNMRANQYRPRA